MLITCTGKFLKQPIEINVSEEEYTEIISLPSSSQQNEAIFKIAMTHIKKYGYDLGKCKECGKNVDFNTCLSCGIKRNLKQMEWAKCKYDNLQYKYPISKSTAKAIKKVDEKIIKKMEPTPDEIRMESGLYVLGGDKNKN